MANNNTNIRHTHGDAETSNKAFAAELARAATEKAALQGGAKPGAAKVAGLAVAGMVLAGMALNPQLIAHALRIVWIW